ncbi:hypothetical protein [Sphingobium sp. D43FB]|uniref:hypothetical protein n=1 Tax=Sphingobium sp. D43FB TaxID=2017595 RepID=UPI000BB58532|nr:hypothetical protein [Sphingobium sp. D43FB]PBN41250.1 hypothetical protein SxD43FB_22885 [Sphingobium sp. D43FB]
MNDNEPMSDAEAGLMRFHEERFLDRAAAQRTIVRQHIHLQATRAYLRTMIAIYVSHLSWFKPLTLGVVLISVWSWLFEPSHTSITFEWAFVTVGLPALLLGILGVTEAYFGRLVYQGGSLRIAKNWRFTLSPTFKQKYREIYRFIQSQRRLGVIGERIEGLQLRLDSRTPSAYKRAG